MSETEDRIQLETVNHKARTSALFGAVVWAILLFVFWVTGTPKRWIPILFALVCAVGLFFLLK